MMLILFTGLLGAAGGFFLSPSDSFILSMLIAMFSGSAAGFLAALTIAARSMPRQASRELSADDLTGLASS